MINTLYLPELREMLAENNQVELQEFCSALHPARTAEFMEGLTASEAWQVLLHADLPTRCSIFGFFDHDKQIEIIETQDRRQIAELIDNLPADDRVDLLKDARPQVVEELMPLVHIEERRDILRLQSYPEGTAGAMMTTDFAKLSEKMTVREALESLAKQAEQLETINYLYVVDDQDHLRGTVTARNLVSNIGKQSVRIGDIMETNLVAVDAMDDQEQVAQEVAKYNFLAIPVVGDDHRILGIITHDDVMDVVHEEHQEDVQRIAAVHPLEDSYLDTDLVTLSWKRGLWLMILFLTGSLTAIALRHYDRHLQAAEWAWLVMFIPLIISTGGNSGSQSATLIISALTAGEARTEDWLRIALREVMMGLLLGAMLAVIGYVWAILLPNFGGEAHPPSWYEAMVVPLTVVLVVTVGTVVGSLLPLLFRSLGLDPALMSNPFVAAISDVMGILIYMNVAMLLLRSPPA